MLSTNERSASFRITEFGSSTTCPLMSPRRRPSRRPSLRKSDEPSRLSFSVTITRDVPPLPSRALRNLSSFCLGRLDLASAGPPSPTTSASASAALATLLCHRITVVLPFAADTSREPRERARSLSYRYLPGADRQW